MIGRDGQAMSVPAKIETGIEPAGVGEQRSGVRRLFDRLTGKSTIALIDQAITSGANFAAVVVVGRAAGADDLGVYSLGFTLLMLVSAAQESLVSSPYTFYSHRVDGDDRAKLAGSSLVHAMGLMLIAVVSLVGVAALMGRSPLADVLWILAAMTPFLLAREYARKFAFAELRMSAALALDATAAGLQIGGCCGLPRPETFRLPPHSWPPDRRAVFPQQCGSSVIVGGSVFDATASCEIGSITGSSVDGYSRASSPSCCTSTSSAG